MQPRKMLPGRPPGPLMERPTLKHDRTPEARETHRPIYTKATFQRSSFEYNLFYFLNSPYRSSSTEKAVSIYSFNDPARNVLLHTESKNESINPL